MGAPNWARLFAEGRCKAVGVPFSDKEWEAIKTGVNPKSIQSGEIKIEEEEVKSISTSDDKEVKKQLKQELRNRGITFTNFDTIEKLQEKLQVNL